MTSAILWVKATSLPSSEPVWVPAQFVYIPYNPAPEEPIFFTLQTTGLACVSTLSDAILGGLLEVIKRDAFMVARRLNRPGRPVYIAQVRNSDARVLLPRLKSRGLKVQATALDNDVAAPETFDIPKLQIHLGGNRLDGKVVSMQPHLFP